MEQIWTVLNSGVGITVLAAALLFGLNALFAKKPAWKKWEGTIIAGIRFAEKNIADDTENRGLAKLDDALGYVLKVYEATKKKQASAKLTAELKEAIVIKHDAIKSTGTL